MAIVMIVQLFNYVAPTLAREVLTTMRFTQSRLCTMLCTANIVSRAWRRCLYGSGRPRLAAPQCTCSTALVTPLPSRLTPSCAILVSIGASLCSHTSPPYPCHSSVTPAPLQGNTVSDPGDEELYPREVRDRWRTVDISTSSPFASSHPSPPPTPRVRAVQSVRSEKQPQETPDAVRQECQRLSDRHKCPGCTRRQQRGCTTH